MEPLIKDLELAPEEWVNDAACTNPAGRRLIDASYRHKTPPQNLLHRLRTLCAGCPVIRDCSRYTLEHENLQKTRKRFGFAAGLTPYERNHPPVRKPTAKGETLSLRLIRAPYGKGAPLETLEENMTSALHAWARAQDLTIGHTRFRTLPNSQLMQTQAPILRKEADPDSTLAAT